jgi:ParB family chromosome partitioning protein
MSKQTKAAELEIDRLVPYEFQSFKPYLGIRAEALVNSVRENGVLTPIIVRPKNDKYEILSGHNRVSAATSVGLHTVPAVILDEVSDDEARVIVVVSNLIQRSFADLSHSERAVALSSHYNAIKSQGKRNDLISAVDDLLDNIIVTKDDSTSVGILQKLSARETIAKTYGLNGSLVAQYLRIAQLSRSLLDRLDNGEFPVRAAVDVSYLKPEEQETLNEVLKDEKYKIDMRKARNFRSPWRDQVTGLLTAEKIALTYYPDDIRHSNDGSLAHPVRLSFVPRKRCGQKTHGVL